MSVPGDGWGEPFDRGLATERTALAWRRTSLSLLIGSLAGARFLPEAWGPPGLVVAGIGIVGALGLLMLSHRRYRMQHTRLMTHRRLPDGTLPALMAAAAVAVGIVALAITATR